MNISITFRHVEPSDAIKRYAEGKLAKLQRFLRQPMNGKVTVSIDRLRHVVEARISSGGEHLEAKEVGDEMYASIDQVMDKLERQIRGSKGAARAKRRGESLRGAQLADGGVGASKSKGGATKAAPRKRTNKR